MISAFVSVAQFATATAGTAATKRSGAALKMQILPLEEHCGIFRKARRY
jgi:hypothetical protein